MFLVNTDLQSHNNMLAVSKNLTLLYYIRGKNNIKSEPFLKLHNSSILYYTNNNHLIDYIIKFIMLQLSKPNDNNIYIEIALLRNDKTVMKIKMFETLYNS